MTNPTPPTFPERIDEILDQHRVDTWNTGWNNDATAKAKAALLQAVEELVLGLVGEDYKPSQLENDKRWVRHLRPNMTIYITKEEAVAANYEFGRLRTNLTAALGRNEE